MALLGTFVDTQTVAAAATASGTFTHGLAASPDIVLAMASYSTVSLCTSLPYWAAQWGSVSVTFFNRGKQDETYTAVCIRLFSMIR